MFVQCTVVGGGGGLRNFSDKKKVLRDNNEFLNVRDTHTPTYIRTYKNAQ